MRIFLIILFICLASSSSAQVCVDSIHTVKYTSDLFTDNHPLSLKRLHNKGRVVTAFGLRSKIILNINGNGNIRWAKEIEDRNSYAQNSVVELGNKSISHVRGIPPLLQQPSFPSSFTVLAHDSLGVFNFRKKYTFEANGGDFSSVTSGTNNDLLMVSNFGSGIVITKVDSLGEVRWNKVYDKFSDPDYVIRDVKIYSLDNTIYLFGYLHCGSCTPISGGIWIMKLDYVSGAMLDVKAFRDKDESCAFCKLEFKFLENQQQFLAVRIRVSGDSVFGRTTEIDTTLRLKRVDDFKGKRPPNINNYNIDVDEAAGRVLLNLQSLGKAYYSVIEPKKKKLSTKKLEIFSFLETPQFNNPAVFNHGGFVDILIRSDSINRKELFLTHALSEYFTGSGCVGDDTTLLRYYEPGEGYQPFPIFFDHGYDLPITVEPLQINVKDVTIPTSTHCKEVSTCDSFKLRTDSYICDSDPFRIVRASKNIGCLRRTEWQIDTAFHQLIATPNDTLLHVKLKKPWQGYIYANIAGCSLRDSVFVSYYTSPERIYLGNDTVLCPNETFIVQAPGGYHSYIWQDGSTDSTIIVKQQGLYEVAVTDKCGILIKGEVRVAYENKMIKVFAAELEVCKGRPTIVTATAGFSKYVWQPLSGIEGNATGNSIIVAPTSTIRYKVLATSANGCIYSDTVSIVVKVCLNQLYVPTAFTPNADNLNDVLRPSFSNSPEWFEFKIFNRFGQMVFMTSKTGEGWNGKIAGQNQPSSTFVWFCRYRFKNQSEQVQKGSFILLR